MSLAVGTRIGGFEILDLVGVGGMGEVYRARDIRLSREVALKILPQSFRVDGDRVLRFEREARLLASLNHPNIATLHSIEDSDGRAALVMELVEGDTLEDLIALRGAGESRRLSLPEAVRIARQIVDALDSAHARGIVHRDLKPSNIKIRPDGTVKVLDFGVAKVFDPEQRDGTTDVTMTVADGGAIVGTPAYMSPERARGLPVDAGADVWAFGCVLYEMLTGRRAFPGNTTSEILAKVLEREPDFALLPSDLPPSLTRLLPRCLQKAPEHRLRHIADARFELQEAADQSTHHPASHSGHVPSGTRPEPERHEPARVRNTTSRWTAATVGAVTLLSAVGAVSMWNASRNETWARVEAIPEVVRLVNEDKFQEAFALGTQAEEYAPDDPMLQSMKSQYAMTLKVTSTPEGADVYVRGYDAVEEERQHLGRTPLETVLPRQAFRWWFEKAEFAPAQSATTDRADTLLPPARRGVLDVELQPLATHSREMVFVPGGRSTRSVNGGSLPQVELPPYLLDREEVTNKDFKEFVDDGGYSKPEFWEGQDFRKDGEAVPWREAVKAFVDGTGTSGPATWELGDYPDGQDAFPVSGVSWFEAVAYARFRSKVLPTVFHWAHASVPNNEIGSGLSPSIVALSNNEGKGPAAAGSYQGAGPFGTFDMAGNVREWAWNGEIGSDGRAILGGSWQDPDYLFHFVAFESPWDRSSVNGFRLMRERAPGPDATMQAIEVPGRTYEAIEPVPDDIFEAYSDSLAYTSGALKTVAERNIGEQPDWIKKRVELEASNGDRLVLYLFVPKHVQPPYQKAVYFPAFDAFQSVSSEDVVEPGFPAMPLDFVIKSGRALIYPVYENTYERCCRLNPTIPSTFTPVVQQWRVDVGRVLDYLDQHPEFGETRTGYIGTSIGAVYPLAILAVERRFAAAILLSGGLPQLRMPPPVDPVNFASRIELPVMMLNGKFDYILPKERYQDPLFERLGSSEKEHHAFETGHGNPPRRELVRHTLRWLDTHLGKVVVPPAAR
jgi:serine/threonine protein kinase/formylglycine-generating enzyme required for sulfatase activity